MRPPRLEVRAATAAEWDAAWESCPSATYFQSRAWSQDWADYVPGVMSPRPLLVRFPDGRKVVLPLTHERRPHGRRARWLMSPAGTYGGWLGAEPPEDDHVLALAAWLRKARAPLWWRVSPFDESVAALEPLADEHDVTHALHLERGFESACERASHGHACAVRKAQREGVSVRLATSASEWETYFGIYEAALARWGDDASSRYGPRLFELLRRRGAPGVKLWLAVLDDGGIIAGGLCLYASRHVSYWHAASVAELASLRPANLLVHEMTLDACAGSLEWFDLNPSGGHEGVRVFKERVGAVVLPSPVIVCGDARATLVDRAWRLARGRVHGSA